MGEQVKITVIATGFRDQMPDRRARMLSVAETPVVSVPVLSVPVVAAGNWMKEAEQPAGPPRFQSEEEEPEPEPDRMSASEPVYFAASSTVTAQSAMTPAAKAAAEPVSARPRFAELAGGAEPHAAAAEGLFHGLCSAGADCNNRRPARTRGGCGDRGGGRRGGTGSGCASVSATAAFLAFHV